MTRDFRRKIVSAEIAESFGGSGWFEKNQGGVEEKKDELNGRVITANSFCESSSYSVEISPQDCPMTRNAK
jgi:hypothetical protein